MAARKEEEQHGVKNITISTGTIFRVVLVLLAAYMLYLIRDIVALFLVALLIAALVNPFASRLQQWGLPRGLAVVLIYLVGLAGAIGLLTLIIPPIVTEFAQIIPTFAPLLDHAGFGGIATIFESGTFSQGFEAVAATIQQTGLVGAIPQLGSVAAGALGGVIGIFVILILAFFLVVEESAIRRTIARVAPAEYQPFVAQMSVKLQESVGYWLRGQLLIMFVVALLDYAILSLLGIPYALVLALFAGLMEIVPFLGPNIAVIPAAVIAFSISPVHAVLVMAAYFVVQQIESNILAPKIMQRATGLNPIITILAILIGFQVGGIVGTLLAIPLAMVCSVFFNEIFRQRADL